MVHPRGRPPLAERRVAPHQVDAYGAPRRNDDVGRDGRSSCRWTRRNAVAAGTTQKPLSGLTAHASSALWPGLRRPRVATVAPSRSQNPAARASGLSNSLADVSGHEARSERVAEVTSICTRRTTGHPLHGGASAPGVPAQQAAQHEADQAEHAPIVPDLPVGPPQGARARETIRCADAHSRNP